MRTGVIGRTRRPAARGVLSGALALALLAGASGTAWAQDKGEDAKRPPTWWEVATGILAIPTAIVGLAYSYVLIRKTHLEIRKTDLENRKLESELDALETKASSDQTAVLRTLARPATEARTMNLLLLRFIIFGIALGMWQALSKGLEFAFTGIVFGIVQLTGGDDALNFHDHPILLGSLVLGQNLPEVGFAILIVLLGWPLFRDANQMLGIELPWIRRAPREPGPSADKPKPPPRGDKA